MTKVKTSLGDKNSNVVYNIPCKCDRYTYIGETCRKWSTRKKEHQSKVRLRKQDIEEGNTERAEQRMNENDGGLARHSTVCQQEIDWEGARIIGREKGWTQRKMLEGVETVKERARGRTPLNTCNQMDQWQPTIYLYMEKTWEPCVCHLYVKVEVVIHVSEINISVDFLEHCFLYLKLKLLFYL